MIESLHNGFYAKLWLHSSWSDASNTGQLHSDYLWWTRQAAMCREGLQRTEQISSEVRKVSIKLRKVRSELGRLAANCMRQDDTHMFVVCLKAYYIFCSIMTTKMRHWKKGGRNLNKEWRMGKMMMMRNWRWKKRLWRGRKKEEVDGKRKTGKRRWKERGWNVMKTKESNV